MKNLRPFIPLLLAIQILDAANRQASVTIHPTEPASLRIIVEGGTTFLNDGTPVEIQPTILEVDPPEVRTFVARNRDGSLHTTPENYAPYFEKWDPWPAGPSSNPTLVPLTPPTSEAGTLLLGHFYRAWQPETLVVEKAGGSLAQKDRDFVFNEDWGLIANKDNGLGIPGQGTVEASIQAALPRLDLIQVDKSGVPKIKRGPTSIACPILPHSDPDHVELAAVWVTQWRTGDAYLITEEQILPIGRPDPVASVNPQALQSTASKLRGLEEVKIAFMGDSIMVGAESLLWQDQDRAYTAGDKTWRGQLVYRLRGQYRSATITPLQGYRGGGRSSDGLERLDALLQTETPDLVVIAYGANDASGPVEGQPRTSLKEYKDNILKMIHMAKEAGAEVLLVETFPVSPYRRGGGADRLPEYNAVLRDLAASEEVALSPVYDMWQTLPQEGIPTVTQIHNHMNHPGELGHRLYAEAAFQVFRAAAGKLPPQDKESMAGVHRPDLAQPDRVPGYFTTSPQPLPPIEEIAAAPRTRLPVYGLYCWQAEYLQFHDAIQEVGWPTLRLSGPITDEFMKTFVHDEVEIMMTIAARKPYPDVGSSVGSWRNRFTHDSDVAFIEDYVGDVKWLLGRYGPNGDFFKENPDLPHKPIRFLEIFNEPNLWYLDRARDDRRSHGLPSDPGEREELLANRQRLYSDLLKACHTAIKEEWPKVQVVGFATSGPMKLDVPFIRAVHERFPDVVNYYDILSTHPYQRPTPPEGDYAREWGSYSIAGSMAEIRDIMRKAGAGDKPVWYTELCWTMEPDESSTFSVARRGDTDRDIPPILHPAYYTRMYLWTLRLGVERMNFMAVTDVDMVNVGMFEAGTAKSWRPTAVAIKNQINLMPHPKILAAECEGTGNTYAYWVESDKGKAINGTGDVLAVWNVEGRTVFTVEWPDDAAYVTVVDMLGGRSQAPVTDGKVCIGIGPLPVYLLR